MSFHETAGQGRTLLLLLYAGILSGVLLDMSALLRRALPGPLRFLPDVLWCVLTAGLCFAALLAGHESKARLFAFLGLLSGGTLYALGLRQVWKRLCRLLPGRKKRKGGESFPHGMKGE